MMMRVVVAVVFVVVVVVAAAVAGWGLWYVRRWWCVLSLLSLLLPRLLAEARGCIRRDVLLKYFVAAWIMKLMIKTLLTAEAWQCDHVTTAGWKLLWPRVAWKSFWKHDYVLVFIKNHLFFTYRLSTVSLCSILEKRDACKKNDGKVWLWYNLFFVVYVQLPCRYAGGTSGFPHLCDDAGKYIL